MGWEPTLLLKSKMAAPFTGQPLYFNGDVYRMLTRELSW